MKKRILFSLVCCIICSQIIAQDLSEPEEIDDISEFVVNGSIWNKNTLYYYVNNSSNHLTASERLSAINQGFAKWAAITNFTFVQVYNEEDSDISFEWVTGNHGDSQPFSADGIAVAHTKHDTNNGIRTHAYIHFNDEKTWSMDVTNYDLVHTCIHEIGHALGLGDTSDTNTIMYGSYQPGRTLSADDHEGIWSLYGCPFSIDGPSCLCQSGTYSFENIPSGYSIRWLTSGCVATGSGSDYIVVSKTDNCLGYVIVRMYNEENELVLTSTQHIYVGTPPQTIGTGLSIKANTGATGYWIAGQSGNKFSIVGAPGDQNRNFEIEAYLYKMDSNFSPTIEMWHRFYNGTQNLEVTTYSEGYYLLKVRGINDCGYSDWMEEDVEMIDPDSYLLLDYNPSTETVTVSFSDAISRSNSLYSANSQATASVSYEIQLWSSSNLIRRYTTNESSYQMSVAGLPAGLYVVRVIKDGLTYSDKFVKH